MSKQKKLPSKNRIYAYLIVGIFSLGYGTYRVITLYEIYKKRELEFVIAIGFVVVGVLAIYRFFKTLKELN
ncbi:hypothetical protein [Zunongwangia endophytica]|uniref:Uncharacterized protein n=1 Tax=Zunongwangia endophytica TaxID=1808945 RepID=A0ABV8H8E6_9FLAO|nr:hypothetical protein [Zunongwangia endophytica]MDN3594962.1 hypothetical protein [Zunongwangia endophytica]